MKKLFLLDAYALIYRAYYAMMRAPRRTTDGLNTSAVFGFCITLDEILRKEQPDFLAVCFDPKGGHTFRHEAYPEYKAQRDKQPEDITLAVPFIKQILNAMRIPIVEAEGFEADDVIGTLSRRAEAEGYMTYMMTPDKDYGQLVTDRVLQYRPALGGKGFEVRGPKEVCERYGIERPAQVIDLLALEGDASDNVPGCPGVGEKTAVKLIGQYGSVEEVIAHAPEIKGALGRKVADGAEQILFSKFLVTIKTDVPLPGVEISDFAVQKPDIAALRDVYTRLEFRSLLRNLGEAPAAAPAPAPVQEPLQMSLFDEADDAPRTVSEAPASLTFEAELIEEPDAAAAFVAACLGKECAVAFNAAGEGAMTARLFGMAIATPDGRAAYIALPDFAHERAAVFEALRPLFAGSATICCHDVKSGMLLLRREGLDWTAPWFSTDVARYLVDPEGASDLADVAFKYLHVATAAYGLSATERKKLDYAAPQSALQPLCERAAATLALTPVLHDEIEKEGLSGLLRDIELPFIPVLARMEWEGVRIDPQALAEISTGMHRRATALEAEAVKLAGIPFNPGSPKQVGEVLFDHLKIDPSVKRKKSGSYSTSEEDLRPYAATHRIVAIILQLRGLRKLLATYIDALPKLIDPRDGKIHTTFKQTVTATGRISSANPNLQNIPVRTEEGREIRRAFVADPGDLLLSADYSQIELRLIADMSADPDMLHAFLSGEDIHRATAAKIYDVPLQDVTDDQRRHAKTANFGIIYGISAFGLAERLGIPRSEAKSLIDGYMRTYPGVKDYIDSSIELAHRQGYVSTAFGRRRQLPDINSRNSAVRGFAERNAVNAPLQGTAADIIKKAMIAVDAEIRRLGLRSRMILQVHDELIFNVKPDELPVLQPLVERLMMQAYSGRVPLEVSSGVAPNWLEAH